MIAFINVLWAWLPAEMGSPRHAVKGNMHIGAFRLVATHVRHRRYIRQSVPCRSVSSLKFCFCIVRNRSLHLPAHTDRDRPISCIAIKPLSSAESAIVIPPFKVLVLFCLFGCSLPPRSIPIFCKWTGCSANPLTKHGPVVTSEVNILYANVLPNDTPEVLPPSMFCH